MFWRNKYRKLKANKNEPQLRYVRNLENGENKTNTLSRLCTDSQVSLIIQYPNF